MCGVNRSDDLVQREQVIQNYEVRTQDMGAAKSKITPTKSFSSTTRKNFDYASKQISTTKIGVSADGKNFSSPTESTRFALIT